MKKYLKIFLSNLCIVIIAVILYSPGLLYLRPNDYSIFRAGMSIIAALALIAAFFLVNLIFLKEPERKPISFEDVPDLEKAKTILKDHYGGKHFGHLAKTASEQLDRIMKGRRRLSTILDQRFTRGTMSWEKFDRVAAAAQTSAIQNVVTMANRMLLFDEKEYTKLQHYRDDDIPDDIQEERIKLYQKNFERVKSTIALNEKILLKLDALALELSSSVSDEGADTNSHLVQEIEKLIEETKYYQ